jgi:hypothetical protein
MMLTVCSAPSVRFCLVLKTIVLYRGQSLSHLLRILSICLMGFILDFSNYIEYLHILCLYALSASTLRVLVQ